MDELAKENEAFGERLKEQEIKHKELGEQATGGRTGTEQIIFYSFIAGAMLLGLVVMSWTVKVISGMFYAGECEVLNSLCILLC